VKNALLEPVLSSFLGNGRRYNLLNSAVLELLEFLRKENMKGLIAAVVNSPQWPKLEEQCDYVDTFQRLKLKHESNLETRAPPLPPGHGVLHGGGVGGNSGAGPSIGPQLPLIAGVPHNKYSMSAAEHSQLLQQRESAAASAAAAEARAAAAAQARQRRGEREEDADEENYFREDDDDDDSDVDGTAHEPAHPALHRPTGEGDKRSRGSGGVPGQIVLDSFSPLPGMLAGRLVDYGDDDDDDDTLPLGVLSRAQGASAATTNTTANPPVVAPTLPPINTATTGVGASTTQPRPRLGGPPQRLETTPKRNADEEPTAAAPRPEKKPKGPDGEAEAE
jgi:protein phosphatase-4 regulatory subunit 3